MNIRAHRRIEAVLAQIIPILPAQQCAYLHHPHIVVSVTEREPSDLRPAVQHETNRAQHPEQQQPAQPVTRENVGAVADHRNMFRLGCFHIGHAALKPLG